MQTTRPNRRKRIKPPLSTRPRDQLVALARAVGSNLSSIGEFEALAGIDLQCAAERSALWWQFRHLFTGPSQVLIDAVVDCCAGIALQRIAAGELALVGRTAR